MCIVHKARHALRYVVWKEWRPVVRDLRAIYRAATLPEADEALKRFAQTWDQKYSTISASWRRNWTRVTVFFDYPPEIRKVIYECDRVFKLFLTQSPKKREAFPTDEAILKVLYLGMQRMAKKGTAPIPEWKRAFNQFAMIVGDRVPTID